MGLRRGFVRWHTYCNLMSKYCFGIMKDRALRTFNKHFEALVVMLKKLSIFDLCTYFAWPLRSQNLIIPKFLLTVFLLSFMIPKQFLELPNSIRKLIIYQNMCAKSQIPLNPLCNLGCFKIASFYQNRFRQKYFDGDKAWNVNETYKTLGQTKI